MTHIMNKTILKLQALVK